MQKFALPLRHFCHLLYKFRRPSGFQNARDSCEYLYFSKVHFVYRWYSPVFSNVSNTTITWTAFWQLIDKDTTWFSKNILVFQTSFALCRCFLASRHKSISQKTYVCPHESSSEKDAPKKFELFSLCRHFQNHKTNFFRCPTPQKQLKPSNWKTACFSNTLRKTHFFWDIPAIRLSDTFFPKHLMTFNNPNLTIYLPWNS